MLFSNDAIRYGAIEYGYGQEKKISGIFALRSFNLIRPIYGFVISKLLLFFKKEDCVITLFSLNLIRNYLFY